jgi:hypothetical protein
VDNCIILEAVYERDVDLLLLEEMHVSTPFRRWLESAIIGEQLEEASFIDAYHSICDVTSGGAGESDLVLLFSDANNQRWAILIENKVSAAAQPEQGVRYRRRGIHGVESGKWQRFKTAIIAPELYLSRGSDVANFDAKLSYEQVRGWFDQCVECDPDRAAFKSKVLQLAIDQSRRGYIPKMDERVTKFYHDYWEFVTREFPELCMDDPGEKQSGSHYAGFRPKNLPPYRKLWHDLVGGYVDLYVGKTDSLQRLEMNHGSRLESDMQIVKVGKTIAAIRIPVPEMDIAAPFEVQTKEAGQAMEAVSRLYRQSALIADDVS